MSSERERHDVKRKRPQRIPSYSASGSTTGYSQSHSPSYSPILVDELDGLSQGPGRSGPAAAPSFPLTVRGTSRYSYSPPPPTHSRHDTESENGNSCASDAATHVEVETQTDPYKASQLSGTESFTVLVEKEMNRLTPEKRLQAMIAVLEVFRKLGE